MHYNHHNYYYLCFGDEKWKELPELANEEQIVDVMKALREWKKYGRGEIMRSIFEYKTSHDKMFIEGFREAEAYFKEEIAWMNKHYTDLFVQFNQLIGRHEWHDLEIDPKDLPEKDDWYWCKYDTSYYGKAQYTGLTDDFKYVVAWCNLPEYENQILKRK